MRLWIAMTLIAVGLAAGTWWLTRSPSPEPAPTPKTAIRPEEQRAVASSTLPTPPRQNPIRQAAAVEPIAVVPETDELPQTPFVAPSQGRPTTSVALDRLVPRPEAGIEPVPWMPYAEEAAELARLRREALERLAEQETEEPPLIRQVRELQETAEPPLHMPVSIWRSRGKLPCSVK